MELSKNITLYHTLDFVYLKPYTVINILFRIDPLPSSNKYRTFLQSPGDFALFSVMKDCLNHIIQDRVGYEASLAHLDVSLTNVDDMAVCLELTGFSDKLFAYSEIVIDILLEHAKEGSFDRDIIMNSIEKKKIKCANSSIDVEEHATSNRLLYLLPHTCHASRIEAVLSQMHNEVNGGANGDTNFCPGKFLKENIIDRISSIQVLVCGNSTEKQS